MSQFLYLYDCPAPMNSGNSLLLQGLVHPVTHKLAGAGGEDTLLDFYSLIPCIPAIPQVPPFVTFSVYNIHSSITNALTHIIWQDQLSNSSIIKCSKFHLGTLMPIFKPLSGSSAIQFIIVYRYFKTIFVFLLFVVPRIWPVACLKYVFYHWAAALATKFCLCVGLGLQSMNSLRKWIVSQISLSIRHTKCLAGVNAQ